MLNPRTWMHLASAVGQEILLYGTWSSHYLTSEGHNVCMIGSAHFQWVFFLRAQWVSSTSIEWLIGPRCACEHTVKILTCLLQASSWMLCPLAGLECFLDADRAGSQALPSHAQELSLLPLLTQESVKIAMTMKMMMLHFPSALLIWRMF